VTDASGPARLRGDRGAVSRQLREFNISFVVAPLFLASMATFFAALVLFLCEILIATRTMRIGPQ